MNSRRFALGAAALALALRLGFTALFMWRGMDATYGRDLYYNLALSWLGWAPPFAYDATHPPLYTAMIAAVLGFFRSANPLPVMLVQCVLGALSAPMTYWAGKRLCDEKTARWAAVWVAVDPGLIFFTPQLATETLFVAMELAFFIWLLDEVKRKPSPRLAAVGLWGGLTVMCRSVLGGYPAFLFLALWRARGLAKAFVFCAVMGIGWLAPSFIWSKRNERKYGHQNHLDVMGWNIYEGFSTDREVIRRRPDEMADEARVAGVYGDPIATGKYFMAKTKAFARENPLEAARIVAGKALLYWRPWPYEPHTWWQRYALSAYFTILFAMALFGARTVWSNPDWAPVWALFAYLSVVHSVFFTSLRYRMPLEPFLCLLAALGLSRLLSRRRA